MSTLNILSLGAGVQSTTVALLSAAGELPKLDCCIFADTQWEPKAVYEHLDWLTEELGKSTIPVHRVTAGNIREDALVSQVRGRKSDGKRWASMPFRTIGPDGKQGMIKRQCTKEYKIEPIERFIKTELLGLEPRARWPIPKGGEILVRQWFGISADESHRMRSPRRVGFSNYYPLRGETFIHRDCVALEDTDLSVKNDGQLSLWGDECEGMCGV